MLNLVDYEYLRDLRDIGDMGDLEDLGHVEELESIGFLNGTDTQTKEIYDA